MQINKKMMEALKNVDVDLDQYHLDEKPERNVVEIRDNKKKLNIRSNSELLRLSLLREMKQKGFDTVDELLEAMTNRRIMKRFVGLKIPREQRKAYLLELIGLASVYDSKGKIANKEIIERVKSGKTKHSDFKDLINVIPDDALTKTTFFSDAKQVVRAEFNQMIH